MARMVRALLKIPAVRRLMVRLANAESAIHEQQTRLGAMTDQYVKLAGLNDRLGDLNNCVERLSADQASERARLAEIAERMPPDRWTTLEAQVSALNSEIAEVARHLPPAERANLEATLHGQQLQLSALNSAMHANQMQLGALNDMVECLSSQQAEASAPTARIASLERTINELSEKAAQLDRENRLLKVGHGATFEELAAAGKTSTGTPYLFEELLSFRQERQRSVPTVPPLVFVHVPKAAGTTLNKILMRNYQIRADSYGANFLPSIFSERVHGTRQAPPSEDDTRRPVFFTGHIGLGNELFRRMPVRYLTITMLRDPVSRIISHYRFNSSAPSVFQSAIIDDQLDVVGYFHRFRSAIPLQYEYFVLGDNDGKEEPTRVEEALGNLENTVSLFGLQENFDEFAVLLAEFLGFPDVFYIPLNRTPPSAAKVTQEQTAELRSLLAADIAFYDGAVKLYHRRKNTFPFDLSVQVQEFAQKREVYVKQRNRRGHPWHDYYS